MMRDKITSFVLVVWTLFWTLAYCAGIGAIAYTVCHFVAKYW